MKNAWKQFRTDEYYLSKYLGFQLLLVLTLVLVMSFKLAPPAELNLGLNHLLLLPFAIVFGIFVPTLMHNCVHGNLKIRPLNRIIGELCCFFVLMGLDIIAINHTLHHAHADTEHDPHNPANKSFVRFFITALFSGVYVIEETFYKFHGKSAKSKMIFRIASFMHYTGIALKLTLWFLILGPTLFVAFFIPAFLTYALAFAHINYITHAIDADGNTEILNIDSNFYYRFVNYIGSGVYYHKNHHLYPNYINPKYIQKNVVSTLTPARVLSGKSLGAVYEN